MVADMVVDEVADMEVDKVADMVANRVADKKRRRKKMFLAVLLHMVAGMVAATKTYIFVLG